MALIPENIELMEIELQSLEPAQESIEYGDKDFFVDFEQGRWTSQMVTGQDKALQWLMIGCKTEKYDYTIYGEFGTPFERLIEQGLPRQIAEGELVRSIDELAAMHEDLQDVSVSVNFTGKRANVTVSLDEQTESVVIV